MIVTGKYQAIEISCEFLCLRIQTAYPKYVNPGLGPLFYQCIEEAVDASENAPEQASYFEDESPKNEMRECYRAVFVDKSI